MSSATVFNTDPAAQAELFEAQGFDHLHLVDLDGAFAGSPRNVQAVEAILGRVSIPVQLGGGIRDLRTIDNWLSRGIRRVILGTAAVRDPGLVREAARLFPGAIAVGIDSRDGRVAVEGWAKTVSLTVHRARPEVRGCRRCGGRLHRHRPRRRPERPQHRGYDHTGRCDIAIPVIASGGLASMDDVWRLLEPDCARLAGAITGRALYDGRLDPREALAALRGGC